MIPINEPQHEKTEKLKSDVDALIKDIDTDLPKRLEQIAMMITKTDEPLLTEGQLESLSHRLIQMKGATKGDDQALQEASKSLEIITSHAHKALKIKEENAFSNDPLIQEIDELVTKDVTSDLEDFLASQGIARGQPLEQGNKIFELLFASIKRNTEHKKSSINICGYLIDSNGEKKFSPEQSAILFEQLKSLDPANLKKPGENIELLLKLLSLSEGLPNYSLDRELWDGILKGQQAWISGDRGAMLLNKAIEGNHPVIIQALINAGANVNLPYLRKPALATALRSFNNIQGDEIVKILVKAGADINAFPPSTIGKEDETFLKAKLSIINNGYDFEKNPEELEKLYDTGGIKVSLKPDSSKFNSLKTLAQQEAEKMTAWLVRELLLSKGLPIPENLRDLIIEKALKEKKERVLELLLDRTGAGKELSIDQWKPLDLLWKMNESTVLKILSKLIEQGEDLTAVRTQFGETFLCAALDAGYIEAARLLIEKVPALLGLIGESGNSVESIAAKNKINLAALKRTQTRDTSSTLAAKKLRAYTDIKTVGHLVGDRLMSGMKDAHGDKLEGGNPEIMMSYMSALCERVTELHSETIAPKTKETLLALAKRFEEASNRSQSLSPLFLRFNLNKILNDLKTQLNSLAAGESILIPYGWKGTINEGHAILMECRKTPNNKWQVILYNTGAGTEFHDAYIKKGKKYINTMKVYEVPNETMNGNEFLKAVLEPSYLLEEVGRKSRSEEDIYPFLEPFSIHSSQIDEKNLTFWAKPQVSGTCSLRCLMAYLGAEIGREEFTKLKPLLEQIALSAAIETFMPRIENDAPLRRLLQRAAPTMFKRLAKELHLTSSISEESVERYATLIEEMEDTLSTLQSLSGECKSANAPFPAPSSSQPNRIDEAGLQKLISQQISEISVRKAAPFELEKIPAIDEVNDIESLMMAINEVNKIVSINSSLDIPAKALTALRSLNQLGRLFLKTPMEGWVASIASNDEVRTSIMKSVEEWSNTISKNEFLLTQLPLDTAIAMNFALAITWQCAIWSDTSSGVTGEKRLDFYGIPRAQIARLLESDKRYGFMSPTSTITSNDCELIAKFFESTARPKNNKPPKFMHGEDKETLSELSTLFNVQVKPLNMRKDLWDHGERAFNMESSEVKEMYYIAEHDYLLTFAKDLPDDLKEKYQDELKTWVKNYNEALSKTPQSGSGKNRELINYTDVDESKWFAACLYRDINNQMVFPPHVSLLYKAAYRAQLIDPLNISPNSILRLNLSQPIRNMRVDNYNHSIIEYEYSPDLVTLFEASEKANKPEGMKEKLQRVLPQSVSWMANGDAFAFSPESQNSVAYKSYHKDLCSALYAATQPSGLQYTMLAEYLENHPGELEKEENQIITFSAVLRNPAKIREMNNSEIENMDMFFKKAIQLYENRLDFKISTEKAKEVLIFLHDLRLRLYLLHGEKSVGRVTNARNELENLLKIVGESSRPNDLKFKNSILTSIILSYGNDAVLPKEDYFKLFLARSWIQANSNRVGTSLFLPQASGEAEAIANRHITSFGHLLQENNDLTLEFGARLLDLLSLKSMAVKSIDLSRFPSINFTMTNGRDVVSYHVLTGRTFLNGSAIGGISEEQAYKLQAYIKNPLSLVLTEEDGRFSGEDELSPFKIEYEKNGDVTIQRLIDGAWYSNFDIYGELSDGLASNSTDKKMLQNLENDVVDFFPRNINNRFQVWKLESSDGHTSETEAASKPKLIALKHYSLERVYQMTDSLTFIFPENDEPVHRVKFTDTLSSQLISKIHPSYELWKAVDPKSNYHRLVYPNLLDERGNPMTFEWKMTRTGSGEDKMAWVWKQNPHLFISEEQTFKGLKDLSRYLVIENSLGKKEVLIPEISNQDHDKKEVFLPLNLKDNNGTEYSFHWKSFINREGATEYAWILENDPRVKLGTNFYRTGLYMVSTGELQKEVAFNNAQFSDLSKIIEIGPHARSLNIELTSLINPDNGKPIKFEWKKVKVNDLKEAYRWVITEPGNNYMKYYIDPDQPMSSHSGVHDIQLKAITNSYNKSPSTITLKAKVPEGGLSGLKDTLLYGPQKESELTVTSMQLSMKKGEISTNNTFKNLYLAYLALEHASGPEDLLQVSQYLRKGFKFDRYTSEELKMLGLIFLCAEKDISPDVNAISLYAYWLVENNKERNPSQKADVEKIASSEPPDFNLANHLWENFWDGSLSWNKPEAAKDAPKSSMRTLHMDRVTRYQEKANHVQYRLKLEVLLDNRELANAGLNSKSSILPDILMGIPTYSEKFTDEELLAAVKSNTFVSLSPNREILRPRGTMPEAFWNLYELACSQSPRDRETVQTFLHYSRATTSCLMAILEAALIANDPDHPHSKEAAQLNQSFMDAVKNARKSSEKLSHSMLEYDRNKSYITNMTKQFELGTSNLLNQFIKKMIEYHNDVASKQRGDRLEFEGRKDFTFKGPDEKITLPLLPPRESPVVFTPLSEATKEFDSLFSHYFSKERTPSSAEPMSKFSFNTKDPLILKGIDTLNKDYEIGREKNLKTPIYSLKEDNTIEQLIESVNSLQKHDVEKLQKIKKEMLDLARTASKDSKIAAREKAEILAGQRVAIGMKDLKALFVMASEEEYRKITHLETSEEITALHNLIGSYLLLKSRISREDQILTYAEHYHETGNKGYLQLLGKELEKKRAIDVKKDPTAFLMLESSLDLVMRMDQLEGLRTMLPERADKTEPPPKVLIQRIQGGGKTLVWGHTLALMKADGYHLSIHIPASPQYKTALNDMAYHSQKIFGQKERTLIFDDRLEHVSKEYLEMMNYTLVKAVADREYVTIPKESLQAMRGKYIKLQKGRLLLNERTDPTEVQELDRIIKQLGDILQLISERGLFTIDEMHQAFDPRIELNLPTGEIVKPDVVQNKLAADLLKYCILAKNKEGQPLLKIKENRQSEQTSQEAKAMLEQASDQLFSSPFWMELFGVSSNGVIDEKRLKALKEYISGNGPFPNHINPSKPEANLVVLARKFLSEGWLTDRLKLSVNEHQGITSDENKPAISVPYLANMKEAEGSEFSDRTVMSVNTLIAYYNQGIPTKAIREIVISMQNEALNLFEEKKAKGKVVLMEEVAICNEFLKATGLKLFDIDAELPEDIEKVKHKLDEIRPEALDFISTFVIRDVLSQVDLYNTQVSSNGQNLASMCRSFNGYTGTFDNLNLSPVGAEPHPDIGTDGQTVDLLMRQNDEVWVVGGSKSAVIDELIEKHPEGNSIQALVDVGCHFRGVSNEEAAKLFIDKMNDPKSKLHRLEGILFFNNNDQLCFINKSQPNDITVLSGTTKEIVQVETGFPIDSLFTFFGNSNIEGFDIAMGDEIKAIVTVGEQNRKHQLFQGSRRLRKLQDMQRIVVAVKQGSLYAIGNSIQKPEMANLQIGKARQARLSVKDLILHMHLNTEREQLPNNLSLAIQKMENIAQEKVLSSLYRLPEEKSKELFKKAESLFDKQVSVDFYAQYAQGMKYIDSAEYLNAYKEHLLRIMKTCFDTTVVNEIKTLCENEVITPILTQIPERVEVPASFDPATFAPRNDNTQNSTQLQTRVAVQKQVTQRIQVTEMITENMEINTKLSGSLIAAKSTPLTHDQIEKSDFGSSKTRFTREGEIPAIKDICGLNEILRCIYGAGAPIFSDDITFTKDFAISTTDNSGYRGQPKLDLLSKFRKDAHQLLYIQNKNNRSEKKLLLLSIEDAEVVLQNELKWKRGDQKKAEKKKSDPNGKIVFDFSNISFSEFSENDMTLLTPQGKVIASNQLQLANASHLENPEIVRLLTQINFFRGSFEALMKQPFYDDFVEWMNSVDRRIYCDFFEKVILPTRTVPPHYAATDFAKVLHSS